jgi:hypothetical protein
MRIVTLEDSVTLSTAAGEASFSDEAGNGFTNDVGRRKLTLTEGTEIKLCAAFPKTHTFMVTITSPAEDEDEQVLEQGAVLRLASFEKVFGTLD